MKNNDNIIKFGDLAHKIKSITEESTEELKENEITDMLMNLLSEKLAEPSGLLTEEEIYEEIADNYLILTKLLGVNDFGFFRFKSYDYNREIILDGKEFDLDGEFCHDDEDATGALCAIDCLMADLDTEDAVAVLKKVESLINIRNMK